MRLKARTSSNSVHFVDFDHSLWINRGDAKKFVEIKMLDPIELNRAENVWDYIRAQPQSDGLELGKHIFIGGMTFWHISTEVEEIEEWMVTDR